MGKRVHSTFKVRKTDTRHSRYDVKDKKTELLPQSGEKTTLFLVHPSLRNYEAVEQQMILIYLGLWKKKLKDSATIFSPPERPTVKGQFSGWWERL